MRKQQQDLRDRLETEFAEQGAVAVLDCDCVNLTIPVEHWLATARTLRDAREFEFAQLTDLCGMDYATYGQTEWDTERVTGSGFSRGVEGTGLGRFAWPDRPMDVNCEQRFAVIVHLLSIRQNQRLRLRCFATKDSPPRVPSLVDIWNAANWYERETFDLYGVIFDGHPDLRRLLTDYGFVGHPLRKDFPLSGNVEVRYDPEQKRVIYEPVSIEPRVLVPRVIRSDSRYADRDVEKPTDA